MASLLLPCTSFAREILQKHPKRYQRCRDSCHLVIKNQRTSFFSYSVVHAVPLIELPGASFDQYMEEKGRVLQAIIPEKATTQQLIQEEWRIKMPAVQALFLTFQPVIDVRVRCKSKGEDYPPEIPHHITKLFEFHTTKWELRGLHADYMPPYFNLKATGTLYPDRQGIHSCIKHKIKINICMGFPPLLAFVPESVLLNVLQSVVIKIVEDVKKGYSVRLLADYSSFKRNSSKNST